MLYTAYETRRALASPLVAFAGAQADALRWLPAPFADARPVRAVRAVAEMVHALEVTHERPAFGIESAPVDGQSLPVVEQAVASTPFATLQRFVKRGAPPQPQVLVVPGLAGHFGTLVRGTVRTLLPDHDVYVADWRNARDVPLAAGRFGLDEYIEHLIGFLRAIGPGAHVMAVCQACVPVLAAAAIMAEDADPAQPQSMILLAGPVDTRINPGPVNEFAGRVSPTVLDRTAIQTVPWPHRGAGRRVYPGFIQVMAFMSLNPRRHLDSFAGLLRDVAQGEDHAAERTKTFYDEYLAVLDLPAEFYLDTVKAAFTEHHLPRGRMSWRGRPVRPAAIETALFTIEGASDEICPPGQTQAAHALCTGIPAERRREHLQAGVGHYGVFSGSRFERQIYPLIRDFIAEVS